MGSINTVQGICDHWLDELIEPATHHTLLLGGGGGNHFSRDLTHISIAVVNMVHPNILSPLLPTGTSPHKP